MKIHSGRPILNAVLLLPAAAVSLMAQSEPMTGPNPHELHSTTAWVNVTPSSSRTLTRERTSSVIFPTYCDDAGNVYLRKGTAADNPFRGPVIRLSSDGQSATRFEMDSVPGVDKSFVAPVWTVTNDGRVVQVVTSIENGSPVQFLVQYDADGHFRRKIELKGQLRPLAIASLRSGDFLVRATPSWDEKDPSSSPPLMAVIDFNGEIVRVWGSDPRPGAQKKGSAGSSGEDAPSALDGALVVDKEGLVWTMTPGRDGITLAAYDEQGERRRVLQLERPEGVSHPTDLFLHDRQALVPFLYEQQEGQEKSRMIVFALYELSEGRLLGVYQPPRLMPGGVVCFTSKQLKLLTGSMEGVYSFFTIDLP